MKIVVTVGSEEKARFCRELGADVAVRPGLVLHHDRLAELIAQPLRERPGSLGQRLDALQQTVDSRVKAATEAQMLKAQKAAAARDKAWDTKMRTTMGSICKGC